MRIPRGTVRSKGFNVAQMHDATDVNGNNFDYSNLLSIMGGAARYTWDTDTDGVLIPKQVVETAGVIGNNIIWPGQGARHLAQIAHSFAVQITATGPLKAQPILDTTLTVDPTLAELEVTAIDGSSPSIGDVGTVEAGTELGSQELIFVPHGSGGGGGGTGGDWYGNGFHGSLTTPLDTTSWNQTNFASSFLTAGGNGVPFGIPDGTYIHYVLGQLFCTDLTVSANTILFIPNGVFDIVHVSGTLTLDGIISSSGNVANWLSAYGGFGSGGIGNCVVGGAGGVGAANGHPGNQGASNFLGDEGNGPTNDPTKFSGAGGNAGVQTGGVGRTLNDVPGAPGDGGHGSIFGSGYWLRCLPGAACGGGFGNGSAAQVMGGACSGGGGAGTNLIAQGGAGGRGAAAAIVCARVVVGAGIFSSDGGNGFPAVVTGLGDGGGGGGGNPASFNLVTEDDSGFSGTFSAVGGTGGAGNGAGANGANGGGTAETPTIKTK